MNVIDLATPAIVIAISLAIMQALKYADPTNALKRFYPIVSLIIGIVLGVLFHFSLLVDLTTALAVAGTYDNVAFTILGKS
jgi:hypothetical protein